MCPQKQAKCGDKQEVEFTETGQEQNLTISGMEDGDACTYKIKSSKGSPCFKVSNDSKIDNAKVNITFIEFEQAKVKETNDTSKGEGKSPKKDMPVRNQTFEDSGDQGATSKGG